MGGTYKNWDYYAFVKGTYSRGWRANSDYQQITAFGRIEYRIKEEFRIGLEYSLLRNRLHMPGGLEDQEFHQNPTQSFRSRNRLTSPWNILALTSKFKASEETTIRLESAFNFSARNIVWRNEDGGLSPMIPLIRRLSSLFPVMIPNRPRIS